MDEKKITTGLTEKIKKTAKSFFTESILEI